jgi:hypothetical protein
MIKVDCKTCVYDGVPGASYDLEACFGCGRPAVNYAMKDEDMEYLPSYQAREFTLQKIKDNMLRYWKDKAIPDCQQCSKYLFEEQGAFITRRCSCSWKISETEHGPRCFFYSYEFIKEEEVIL